MIQENEIKELYEETMDKIVTVPPPDPGSFMQGFMILKTLNDVLARKGLRAEISINIVETNGVNKQ